MTAYQGELVTLTLPEFGLPSAEPAIPATVYRERLTSFRQRMQAAGYDVAIVYGDREHFANVAYLTGYDPRFEEAMLVVDLNDGSKPLLVVGNEGYGYAPISPVVDDFELVLFQSFSLLGQDRSRSRKLAEILRDGGVTSGTQIGIAGWKYFSSQESDMPDTWLETPAYLADTLRTLTGDPASVRNATAILMSNTGLRAINEVEQLACFEYAATFSSQAVRNVLFNIQPGITEYEAVELMHLNGLPLSCHLMLSGGERARMGLPSPSSRRIVTGDPVTTAVGFWGGLTCRAGFLVASAADLPSGIQDYVERLVAPYFQAIAAWYATVGIGVPAGELYRAIFDHLGDPFFGIALNPGHLLHLDEWVNSPVYEGSTEVLQSGMAIQVDVIPATGTAYFTSNIEDGIALADAELRAAFAHHYPDGWGRIQARRTFMQDVLGIQLKPEVLPFSNIPAYLPPFWLSPQQAMHLV
jgi:creatinase/prolidase-like protein/peptidase M24-like protein